jgi:hypothetical protein
MKRSSDAILHAAEETLASARAGLEMLSHPKSRRVGIRNVIVFGRAFTNVVQNLRSSHGAAFETWYSKYQEEMRRDELMAYFYALRSEILKEGTLRVSNRMMVTGNLFELMSRYPTPKYSKGFFICDENGGSGWDIEFPDGTKEKLYVDLPSPTTDLVVESILHLPEAPASLHGIEISELALRYVSYFEAMLADARRTFIPTKTA